MSKSIAIVGGLFVLGVGIKLYEKYSKANETEASKMINHLVKKINRWEEIDLPQEFEIEFPDYYHGDKVVIKQYTDNLQKRYWVIDSPKFGRLVVGNTGFVAVATADKDSVDNGIHSWWRDAAGQVQTRNHTDFEEFKAHIAPWFEGV